MLIETIHLRTTKKHLGNIQLLKNQRNAKLSARNYFTCQWTKVNMIKSILQGCSATGRVTLGMGTQGTARAAFVTNNYTSKASLKGTAKYRINHLSVMFIAILLRISKNEKQLKIKIRKGLNDYISTLRSHPIIQKNSAWPPPTCIAPLHAGAMQAVGHCPCPADWRQSGPQI